MVDSITAALIDACRTEDKSSESPSVHYNSSGMDGLADCSPCSSTKTESAFQHRVTLNGFTLLVFEFAQREHPEGTGVKDRASSYPVTCSTVSTEVQRHKYVEK